MTSRDPAICSNPQSPKDDRHVATLVDDLTRPMTNDRGDVFYMQTLVHVCCGCYTPLDPISAARTPDVEGRWLSAEFTIEEDPA